MKLRLRGSVEMCFFSVECKGKDEREMETLGFMILSLRAESITELDMCAEVM